MKLIVNPKSGNYVGENLLVRFIPRKFSPKWQSATFSMKILRWHKKHFFFKYAIYNHFIPLTAIKFFRVNHLVSISYDIMPGFSIILRDYRYLLPSNKRPRANYRANHESRIAAHAYNYIFTLILNECGFIDAFIDIISHSNLNWTINKHF